jgi:hypothetical protein
MVPVINIASFYRAVDKDTVVKSYPKNVVTFDR